MQKLLRPTYYSLPIPILSSLSPPHSQSATSKASKFIAMAAAAGAGSIPNIDKNVFPLKSSSRYSTASRSFSPTPTPTLTLTRNRRTKTLLPWLLLSPSPNASFQFHSSSSSSSAEEEAEEDELEQQDTNKHNKPSSPSSSSFRLRRQKGSSSPIPSSSNPDLLAIPGVGPRNFKKLVQKGIAGVAQLKQLYKDKVFHSLSLSL